MMMKTLICVVGCAFILLFHISPAQAQCDCDFIIPASMYAVDGTKLKGVNGQVGVKPGDKVCFANGTRIDVMMTNFTGTAANPILITNMCDGQVKIQGASASTGRLMYMGNCKYVRVSGAGNPGVQYGIEMTVGVQGLDFRDLSTNCEADHLYIHDISYSALNAKTDPTCDSKTWRGHFTMRDIWIHDNKVSNIGGEGVYIGESHYHTTVPVSCNGTTIQAQEHETIGCKVYNNVFTNIGRDGIQVGAVTSGGEIHHNKITNFGRTNEYGQQSGIQINPGTNALVYNNVVDTGTGFGLFAGGRGGSHVYNNIIANCAQGAIICADYAPVDPSGFIFSNNTLINNKVYGIYMLSEATNQNQFVNNIIVGTGSGFQHVKLNSPKVKWTESNNIKTMDISSVKFVNAGAKDWRLQTASTAKDAGKDMRSYGVTKDLDETARPQGGALDIGAYELKTGGSTANKAPVANAGADKTITLPTTTTSLTGSGTDADGTIASYAWTKLDGSNVTLGNATSATLGLSGLIAGRYTFRLTVKDNAGATATDDVVVTVNATGAANKAPVANAGADQTVTLPTTTASVKGSGTDTDGSIASYAWTKLDGGAVTLANATSATLSLSGLAAGRYTFRFTVKDNKGATAHDDVVVTVKAAATTANQAPVANAGADQTVTLPTTSISVKGSGTDADGSIASYAWTKLDGGTVTLGNATSATMALSGLAAGRYTFRLTIKDNKGATDTDDVVVTVKAANIAASTGNAIPVPNAGGDRTITLPTNSLSIAGSATDADGIVMYWEWTKVSGGAATLTDVGKSTLKLSGLAAGTYVFRLKVTDNLGAWKADDVTVTVKAAAATAARMALMAAPEAADSITVSADTANASEASAVSDNVAYAPQTSEEEFVIMDKHFPGGHQYAIMVYDADGTRIYAGAWSKDRFDEIFEKGKMYIYHVIQDGVKIDAGKVAVR